MKLNFSLLAIAVMLLAFSASPAHADEVLDQENVFDVGGIAVLRNGNTWAQTVTVGVTGQLTGLDLIVGRYDADVESALHIQIREVTSSGTPGSELGSIAYAPHLFPLHTGSPASGGFTAPEATELDISDLDIEVEAGEQIAIVLTSYQEGPIGYSWYFSKDDDYAGGRMLGLSSSSGWYFSDQDWDQGFRTWVTEAEEVDIDVKPDSDTNPINLKSRGSVPVAVLGSADLDVDDIDTSTVTFAGASVATKPNGTLRASTEDVNGDGYTDLVLHFPTEDLDLQSSDTEATLEGQLDDGTDIVGSDSVTVKS